MNGGYFLPPLAEHGRHLADEARRRADFVASFDPERAAAPDLLPNAVGRAVARIGRWLNHTDRPYVAYSGGKDSLVVLSLIEAFFGEDLMPAVWSDDELEYPGVVEHMRTCRKAMDRYGKSDLFRVVRGTTMHEGWFRSWTDRPYWRVPLPRSERVAGTSQDWARAEGFDGVALGLRMEESRQRKAHGLLRGGVYQSQNGEWRCQPIYDWTDAEVWGYLAVHDLLKWLPDEYVDYHTAGIHRSRWRVGPIPCAPRSILETVWPDLWARLSKRYGADRWQ